MDLVLNLTIITTLLIVTQGLPKPTSEHTVVTWSAIHSDIIQTNSSLECISSEKDIIKCYDNFNDASRVIHKNSLGACCHFAYVKECLKIPLDVCQRNWSVEVSSLNSKLPECAHHRYRSIPCVFYFYWPHALIFLILIITIALLVECFMFEGQHFDDLKWIPTKRKKDKPDSEKPEGN